MVVPVYIPTNSAGCSLFSTLSPAFVTCGLTNDGHSDWCEVVSHGSFDLHLETPILNEVSQKEKDKYHMISLISAI